MEAMVFGKADAWRRHIDEQRASGLSVRAWCKANDAREHSFYWWRCRLGLSPVEAKPATKRRRFSKPVEAGPVPLGFARVVVNHPVAEPLRLRLAGPARAEACVRELILPASMPLEQVARLVHAIEGAT